MNIQTLNNFIYLDQTYISPYFVISYNVFPDLEFTPIDCFMYLSKESYTFGDSYKQSYAHDISTILAYNEFSVLHSTINFLTTISPTSLFEIDNI